MATFIKILIAIIVLLVFVYLIQDAYASMYGAFGVFAVIIFALFIISQTDK